MHGRTTAGELKALLADQEAIAEIVQCISVALEPLWHEEEEALKQLINAGRMIDETESEVIARTKEALEADADARTSVKSSINILKRAWEKLDGEEGKAERQHGPAGAGDAA